MQWIVEVEMCVDCESGNVCGLWKWKCVWTVEVEMCLDCGSGNLCRLWKWKCVWTVKAEMCVDCGSQIGNKIFRIVSLVL